MTVFFIATVLSLVTIAGSIVQSKDLYHGCYESANLNRTINTLKKKATGLGRCIDFCSISSSNYAALHGAGDCYCLQDLTELKRVEEARCTQKCPQLAHLSCGGPGTVSIFTTGFPIIFNVSFTSHKYTGLSNATQFIIYGSLTRSRHFKNESSSERDRSNVTLSEYISRNSVSVTWKIDGTSAKRVNKTVKDYHFNDTLNYGFKAHGKHEVCFNISNVFSWVSNCSLVIALESIHTLELVNIQGGKQTTTGKYALEESTSFHIDVVVNAGSFADLHVDFGDGSGVSAVRKGYHATRKNCSCLALTRKGHSYQKKGVFSLNITALNELERKEIIYNETIIVEGKITGAAIKTKHAAAGTTSEVYVDVYGSAKDVVYRWTFAGGRQEKTDVPFIEVDFPNNAPQFRVEVKVFNNISGVTVEGVIYIEPTIRNVTITAGMNIAVIEKDVIFTVQSIVDYVTFATTKRYTWDLGSGEKLGGTFDKLVYRYKKSGRFHARVMAENFISKVFSNYVEIQVYEKITKITLSYKPFIFGETAELNAHVNDGSNVTYVWDFGDSNSLTTDNATVYHLFNSPGNYTVTVQARNPVSQKQKNIEMFVTSYACQKPVIAFSRGSYEQNIKLSSEIRLDVDVAVNCSVSRRTKYQWKVFNITGERKIEMSHSQIGVSQAILAERSLILPHFSLKYGKFEIELKVEMEGTIVYSRISKLVNILPTGLHAYILGGTVLSVGRKSHQNITLDGSYSYDPDERHSSKLRFFWECRSIKGSGYGTCFKPNTTMGFNWSTPVLQFLPKILVKSADMFAFMVTISKPGMNNATAVQFLKLEEGTFHSLKIGCPECRSPDVNTHQDIRFSGTCNDCGNTPVSYSWKVYAAPKVKVFLRLFGKCIPPDGSAWLDPDRLKNNTNATTTQVPTTLETTTLSPTTIKLTTTKANTAETDFQKLICEADLKALKENATGLLSKSRKRRNVAEFRSEVDSELESVESELEAENNNLKWDLSDDKNEGDEQDVIEDELTQERYRRGLSSDGSSGTNDEYGIVGQPNADHGASASAVSRNSSVRVLRFARGVGSGQSNGNAGIGAADASGGSGFPRANRPDTAGSISGSGRGPTVTGTGSGRPPSNSGGSGRGCEGSSGVGGGRGIGSGSGARPGCSGTGSGFGEGAKNHANKTGGSTSNGTTDKTGGSSGNLVYNSRDKELKAKSQMIREVMHVVDLQTGLHSGSKSKNFLLRKTSLVPGQLYMVEFTAKWDNGGETRVAGNAKSFFFTNTGPYLGSCKVEPRIGREIATNFFLSCDHWKDKHFPLQYSVQYKVTSDQNYTLIYTGLHSDLNFSLPAGDVKRNYTIDLEVIVTDTEGVKTNLCPISVQVLPFIEVQASVEEMLYNKTIGNGSLLKYNEDVSDVLQATVLISSITNTINRLPSVSLFSSKHQLRKEIRERLLASLLKFTVLEEVFAKQILSITSDLTNKQNEVTLSSVQSSNNINKRVISFYKTILRSFPLDVITKIFTILSNALATTSHGKALKNDQLLLRSLVKEIISIHDEIVQIRQSTSTTQSQPLILNGDVLTTITTRFDQRDTGILSGGGCSFVLPSELQERIQNLTTGSNSVYSMFSVYGKSPFVWDKINTTISTKVSSLDFKNVTGANIEVFNLTQPVRITLPVQAVTRAIGIQANAVLLAKMNIHDFNLTGGQSPTYFIRIEDVNEEERSRNHLLKAIVRYNEAPTQRLFNHSLTFINKTASLYINPKSDVKKIFVGVFLRTLGRETMKKENIAKAKYKIKVYNARCLFWDEVNDVWNNQGCVASPDSTPSEIVCSCNHLTAFGGQIEYVPCSVSVQSLIDFKSVDDPYIVLVTILSLIGLYLLLIVYFGIIERPRRRVKSFAALPDNHPADLFRYLVIVETGNSVNAGTTARVSMVVHGKEGHSQIRELTCHDATLFGRGATDCIIMSFPDSLGDIKKIRLWHDNGGKAPDWFLKQMTIVDCQTEKRWYFHWNNWLAITENTKVDCELPAKMEPLIYNLQVIFEGFLDYHSWLSIFTKPDRSNYSHIQRLTVAFASVTASMFLASAYLNERNIKNKEILDIWDINWSSILISIVIMAIIFPIQLLVELLFRNCSRMPKGKLKSEKHIEETSDDEKIPEKGQEMGNVNGAFFFMEVNTDSYSSQNVMCDDEDNDLQQRGIVEKGSNSRFGISLPHWCGYLLTVLCLLLSVVALSITLLHGISFQRNIIILWAQAVLLSILYSMGIVEIIKALFLATYRLFKLSREALIADFLTAFHWYDKAGGKGKVKRNEAELTEKQIMAARARARFVRFSKPLVGECLRKARQKAMHWNNITFYTWQFFTLTIYLTTLGLMLHDAKTKDEYLRQNAIKNTIMSPAKELSFGNITTQAQFWDWSEVKFVEILKWNSWFHLRSKEKDQHFQKLYIFGPARLQSEDKLQKKEKQFSNSSQGLLNYAQRRNEVLLVGNRDKILTTLSELQSTNWMSEETKRVTICFSYYHPPTSAFSYVQLIVDKLPTGNIETNVQIDNAKIYSDTSWIPIAVDMFNVLSFLLVLLSLRKEFCCLMDNGFSHLKSGWNVIEAIFIIFVGYAVLANINLTALTRRALHKIGMMEVNDSDAFLDLKVLVKHGKILHAVYATLLFLVLLKCLRILTIWKRFAVYFSTLEKAFAKLLPFMVVLGVTLVALSHTAILLVRSHSLALSKAEGVFTLLSSIFHRSSSFPDSTDRCLLFKMLKVIAVITLFGLWRLSAVFYIGQFKAAKLTKRRSMRLLKKLKKGFRKLRSKKTWLKLWRELWKRIFKRQEDKYKVCNLPLENVYEEIEYQVEEVLFRLNNLFDLQDRPDKFGQTMDDDDYTLDSSEEAAYPSSFSTKDNISFTSESIYSEDSGYYRYGDYRGRFGSTANSDDDYEGPIIHHLDEPKQRLSDLGQIISPIFGGRYFVKTSWSTFRAPKIKPGSIDLKPPSPIKLPVTNGRKTFEKIKNWGSKNTTPISVPEEIEAKNSLDNFLAFPNTASTLEKIQLDNSLPSTRGDANLPPLVNTERRLPRALESMSHKLKLAPRHDDANSPFKQPPKLPSISEIMAQNRKRRSLKRTQVLPIEMDSPSSMSLSSDNESLFRGSTFQKEMISSRQDFPRSPSLDSGIIRSSETEESEISHQDMAEQDIAESRKFTSASLRGQPSYRNSMAANSNHCW